MLIIQHAVSNRGQTVEMVELFLSQRWRKKGDIKGDKFRYLQSAPMFIVVNIRDIFKRCKVLAQYILPNLHPSVSDFQLFLFLAPFAIY